MCNLKGGIVFIVVFLASSAWSMGNDLPLNHSKIQFLSLLDQAANPSLVYNNEGITPTEGGNLYISAVLLERIDRWEVMLEPLIVVGETTTLHKGYLRYHGDSLNIELGRNSLWWGQGVHGSLLLSNNAAPLNLVRLYHPKPTVLPGVLRVLGPFQLDLFMSQLEEERVVVPKPFFQGTRFYLKPHSMLELGLTRTIILGGEGRPSVTPSRFLDIWFGENKEGAGVDLSNSIGGFDVNLIFSEARFYMEFGGEDEAGYFPSKEAYLYGASFPEGGLLDNDFRIEYADITDPSWYVHSLYQSGYTYKKRILGHHVGRGGRDLYLEHGILNQANKRGKITFDYEERGVGVESVTERHYQVGTDWEFKMGRTTPWTIQTGFLYEWVKNVEYRDGFNQDNALATVSFIGQM